MKKITTLLLFFIGLGSFAQVGIGNTNPDPSSILDLTSTTQGMLAPRMTESERDAITSPANGLLIYQTNNASGFYYWDGSSWKSFGGGGTDNDWTINGSNMYNANPGNIGIGNTNPETKLHITGITTLPSGGGSGGTSSLYQEDFSSSSTGNVSTTPGGSYYESTSGGSNTWTVTTVYDANCAACIGKAGSIGYVVGSSTDTLITNNFTPSVNTISISFDYGYRPTLTQGDYFKVVLFNNSTSSSTTLLNALDSGGAINGSYLNTTVSVNSGDNYELQFTQKDNFNSFGSTIDNISVAENSGSTTPISGSYVFRLDDGQQAAGKVLTSDANGNATWQPAGAGIDQTLSISGNELTISGSNSTVTLPSGSGGGGTYSFTNGITESGGTVKLGGTITEDTTLNLDDFDDLIITNDASGSVPGQFIATGDTREVFSTYLQDDFIQFGGTFPGVPTEDNDIFTDSGGRSFRKDFVAGFHSDNSYGDGTAGGTAIQLGSIEHIMDGQAELFVNNDFNPLTNGGANLGSTSRRWGAIYAVNGTIQTSDLSLKKNIKNLNYGLDEIMKLETITYNWKNNTRGKTKIPDNLLDKKIGFSAQQLLKVLPETVNTHSWVAKDEKGNYERVKNDHLGVYYSDIIPVVVKAIQEQQGIIEAQNKKLESLETQILNIEILKSQISNLEEMVNKLISSEK
jgi:hypothetical protein